MDAEVRVGDRLFFETRFSQVFFEHCRDDVNARLSIGDPIMNSTLVATGAPLEGRFRGAGMNCRQCHLGDDFLPGLPFAGRTYGDFARRSPLPRRSDGLLMTVRNSPSMVDLGLSREVPALFHFDGEFADPEDLVIDTLTGRNLGWVPGEASIALAHVAGVIRSDSGVNPRHVVDADGIGIPYRAVMLGTDPRLPTQLRIPPQYRLDVSKATDDQVVRAIARLIHAYMDSIRFGTRKTFRDSGSPYDLFLARNSLPAEPLERESSLNYTSRLLAMIKQRSNLGWITSPTDGEFKLHRQAYQFGTLELDGLKIFFTRAGMSGGAHVGNCVSCHTPPRFTDQSLHNNGVSQAEYDSIFGRGSFAALQVPNLATRNWQFDDYLPSSARHPNAKSRFRAVPAAARPGFADLGVWNVFANPDMPKPQAALAQILCGQLGTSSGDCSPEAVLPLTIGLFKTASVRDLGQSNPYFHSGALDTVEDVLRFYISTSELARSGDLRNGSPEISGIRIDATDIAPLSAFLRSLNEDYH